MKSVFYIDPQSGDNLAMYDYELISRIKDINISYICSASYDYKELDNATYIPLFNYTRKRNSIKKALSYCLSLFKLLKRIKRNRPQILHIQWFKMPTVDYIFYRYVKNKYNTKIIHTAHNILPHISNKGDYNRYSRLYKICDEIITHTSQSKSELHKQFHINDNNIIVAPHGPLKYDISKYEIDAKIVELKNEFKISATYIASLLGYQSIYKGTDLAIEAWKESNELTDNQDICLIVAGQNRDYKSSNIPNSNIIIINRKLSDVEFAALLRMTSLMVMPYRRIDQSGLLLTIIEENIPYCATDVGELSKPLEIGDIGWRINDITKSNVQSTLEEIFRNPSALDYKKNQSITWKRIKELYSWDYAAKVTSDIYNEL